MNIFTGKLGHPLLLVPRRLRFQKLNTINYLQRIYCAMSYGALANKQTIRKIIQVNQPFADGWTILFRLILCVLFVCIYTGRYLLFSVNGSQSFLMILTVPCWHRGLIIICFHSQRTIVFRCKYTCVVSSQNVPAEHYKSI